MSPFSFTWLYVACLALCLGIVEGLQIGWEPEVVVVPQEVDSTVIAVPPKPEGARPVQGEGDEAYRYTEQGCLKHEAQLRDICFGQLARQRAPKDLDGALSACDQITDSKLLGECQADVAEGHAPTDREAALAVCPTIKRKKWRDQCVFGIALSHSTIDSPWAFRLCDQSGQWVDFCRHDVNGEIAQVNDRLALEHCHAEEGDILRRKTCWHGIGKYIARVDVARAFRVCNEDVPLGPDDLYRENCMHGVGWGAAETAGAAFAAQCDRGLDQRDSCLLGVAYFNKRVDVDVALGICRTVQRPDLRSKCEQWVGGG